MTIQTRLVSHIFEVPKCCNQFMSISRSYLFHSIYECFVCGETEKVRK